ncbi:hypothetical protein [Dechloromonas sp. A34]|uniref:hypothetical protein n=1 Tax=Dechloromonas sp. A34 TaxID=447588 RepID=UPI002248C917|nr:hypothetical protein [Dechloromonas sp. A34]
MENASFGHRQHERQQQQQQPQQSAFYSVNAGVAGKVAKADHPRNTWQLKAMAQARKQSGSKL